MLFAIFIQKLHSCVEPYKGRGAFTEKIIKLIVTDEKKLEHRSMQSFNGYYDGKTEGKGKDKKIIRDMINAYAINIVQFLDESEDKTKSLPKFKAYLKGLQFNTAAKNEICDSFRCELPNINTDNYIDELAELLIRIIRKAANSESRAISIPEIGSVEDSDDNIRCNNKSSHRPDPNSAIELVEALADTLSQMFSISIEIAESKGRELENGTNNVYQLLKIWPCIDLSSSITNKFISEKNKELENLYQNLFITYGESIRRLASTTNDNALKEICRSLDNIEISDFDSGIICNNISLPNTTNDEVLEFQNLLESFLNNKND